MYDSEFALMDQQVSRVSDSFTPHDTPTILHADSMTWNTAWEGVIVADSQRALGELLVERLNRTLAPLTIWSATTIDEVRTLVGQHPNVLIVSPQRLVDGSILQLARLVRAESSQARIAVWADYAPQLVAPEEYAALVPRSSSVSDFEERLKAVLTSHACRASCATPSKNVIAAERRSSSSSVTSLSDRQLELLVLIAEGLSIKEIAQRWRLTNKSVDSLKYRLMKELNIHNRVDLARLAILEGLIDPRQIGSDESAA